ncbi:TRAF3-interacting protein 1, partial [Rhizophlyctis rosea]
TNHLRTLIQHLCRSTHPLGKTLDYIQEDVDSMNKELESWRKECARLRKLEEDANFSTAGGGDGEEGGDVGRMSRQVRSIEGQIEVQVERIAELKAGIIQNDATIQRLVRNVTHPVK